MSEETDVEQETTSPLLLEEEEDGGGHRGNLKGCHFLLALLFAGGILGWWPREGRPGVGAERGLELWIPTGWHKDPQGHDVKDTWDHYKMPLCDSGPALGTLKKVYLHAKKLRKMKDLDEDDVLDDRRLGEEKNHTEVLKDKLGAYRLEPVKRTRAQELCARHKAIATADHQGMVAAHYAFEHKRDEIRGLHYWQGQRRCGAVYANTDFGAPAPQWQDASGGASPAHCQRSCTWNPKCQGFSWNPWGCYLKQLPKDVKNFTHKPKAGVWSGYHCQRQDQPYEWINDELQKHSLPRPKTTQVAEPGSMFCTMLLLPYTYEVDLALMQHKNYYSIFACEQWQIYSSQRMVLKPGVETRLIKTSQVAEMAGQWGTALNTEAFLAYWRAMLEDGEYLKANWLVKVDPDTVWFPQRLQPILLQAEEKYGTQEPGVYLNNCEQGLHGPIEVLSQSAFSTLARYSAKCYWAMNDWGNWQWGEDMWLDQCLLTVAHAKRVYVPKMLAEDHCNNWPGWRSCEAHDVVAFHPFKKADEHIRCTATAITTSTTATTTSHTQTTRTATTTVTVTKTATYVQNPLQSLENFVGHVFQR